MKHKTVFKLYKEATCLVYQKDELLFQSSKKGVAPLLDFYKTFGSTDNVVVVDRIVGKGAAILADLIGATEIHTPLISKDALTYCEHHLITVHYDKIVPYIINRNNDGRCPIESSVLTIDDKVQGYHIIVQTLDALRTSEN